MRGIKVERKCEGCLKKFFALVSKVKQGFGKFCSTRCYQITRSANKISSSKADRKHQIKHKYGIDQQSYDKMLADQNNRCAICKKQFGSTPNVDHDHLTLRVRGLLCGKCNTGLGMFEDNKELLEAAIKYIAT